MGRVHVKGPGARDLLDRLTPNDVRGLERWRAHYTLLTNPDGGIIDDIIIYCMGDKEYAVVVNASNTEKDLEWIRRHSGPETDIEEYTDQTAMIAVQGPAAVALVDSLTDKDLTGVERFGWTDGHIAGAYTAFCRTGYTGEDGFELITPAQTAVSVWNALVSAGAVPCGLGARDALRIEAGYPLYGHEIDDTTTPVEAGLMWVVKLDKGEFVGRESIARMKEAGPARKLVGLTLQERIVPRQGYTLHAGGAEVGVVTSGVFSPTRQRGLGMAYVDSAFSKTGTVVDVSIRSSRYPATIVAKKNLLQT
jgi:aminomethyltransferase